MSKLYVEYKTIKQNYGSGVFEERIAVDEHPATASEQLRSDGSLVITLRDGAVAGYSARSLVRYYTA